MDEPKITEGQSFALLKLCSHFAKDRPARLYLIEKLINRKVESSKDLTLQEWRLIRNRAYPHWSDNNWEVGDSFNTTCNEIMSEYEEKVLGQMKLF